MRNYIKSVLELDDKLRVFAIIVCALLVLGLSVFHIVSEATDARENGITSMQQHMQMSK